MATWKKSFPGSQCYGEWDVWPRSTLTDRAAAPALGELLGDERPVCLYEGGDFRHTTVPRWPGKLWPLWTSPGNLSLTINWK